MNAEKRLPSQPRSAKTLWQTSVPYWVVTRPTVNIDSTAGARTPLGGLSRLFLREVDVQPIASWKAVSAAIYCAGGR